MIMKEESVEVSPTRYRVAPTHRRPDSGVNQLRERRGASLLQKGLTFLYSTLESQPRVIVSSSAETLTA